MIKKFECVYQDNSKDCAVASLLTIIRTYGGNVSKEYLRILTNTDKNGANAYYLIEAAKLIGFDTRALNGDVLELENKMLPCIAHVIIDSKYKHFVVIHKITNKYLIIADPSKGILKMSIDEFKSISTNNFFIFIPNKKIPYIKNDKTFVNNILKYFFENKRILISILFFSSIYTLFNIIISYGFQFIIEDSINVNSIHNLYFIVFFLLVFIFLKYITDFVRLKLFNYINYKLDFILTKDVFKHLLSLPYEYYKTRTTGDVLSRINDLSHIRDTFSNIFVYLFVDGILVIFILFTLLRINVYLSISSIIIIILYLLIIKMFSYPLNVSVKNNKEMLSKVNNSFIETLQNINTIKSLRLENQFMDKNNDLYVKYLERCHAFSEILNIQTLFKNIINNLGSIMVLFLGGLLVLKKKMSLTELITYNSLIVYFLQPIKNIIDSDIKVKDAKEAINRIIELYSIEKEKIEMDEKYTNKEIKGNIKFINLDYSYNGRNKVLSNINLEIKSGEKVLICGCSGGGKSTLAKILMKFLNVENDKVILDDKDINNYNISEIRRDVCYVSQNESLITDTIYNNIVLDRNIDYDVFLSICKKLDIDKIAKRNLNGYNMLLEENGFNLSGGERQKIIMARSLLKLSSIYIFDESLNQVDIESERNILNKIFKLYKEKTIIMISHRFNNNDLFDRVYNIEGGILSN